MKGITPYQKSLIETWLLRAKIEPDKWTVYQALKSIEEIFPDTVLREEKCDCPHHELIGDCEKCGSKCSGQPLTEGDGKKCPYRNENCPKCYPKPQESNEKILDSMLRENLNNVYPQQESNKEEIKFKCCTWHEEEVKCTCKCHDEPSNKEEHKHFLIAEGKDIRCVGCSYRTKYEPSMTIGCGECGNNIKI